MVTITSPKSVYVDNNSSSTYTLEWINEYEGQYAFEILYKLKTSNSWLTTGKITSSNIGYDLRKINDLLGVEIDEIQYRLIVYYKNTQGIESKDFSDAALIYSLIFKGLTSSSLKIFDGKQVSSYPLFSEIKNTNIEKLNINTSSGTAQLPLVEDNSPLSGEAKIKTKNGIKHFAISSPKFTYDSTKLTTYGTVSAYYGTPNYQYSNYSVNNYTKYYKLDYNAYNNYATKYYTKYTVIPASYNSLKYDGIRYTLQYNGTYYTTYTNNYRAYTYLESYSVYNYLPKYAYPYPTAYRSTLGYYVSGSYYYTYLAYSYSGGPVYGGGGGPIFSAYYYGAPTAYGYTYGPAYYVVPYIRAYAYKRYYYLSGYVMTRYGPNANYSLGHYSYVSKYSYYTSLKYAIGYAAHYRTYNQQYNTYGTVRYNYYTSSRYNYYTVYNYNNYKTSQEISGYYISSVTPAKYSTLYSNYYTLYYYSYLTGYTPRYYKYNYTVQ